MASKLVKKKHRSEGLGKSMLRVKLVPTLRCPERRPMSLYDQWGKGLQVQASWKVPVLSIKLKVFLRVSPSLVRVAWCDVSSQHDIHPLVMVPIS